MTAYTVSSAALALLVVPTHFVCLRDRVARTTCKTQGDEGWRISTADRSRCLPHAPAAGGRPKLTKCHGLTGDDGTASVKSEQMAGHEKRGRKRDPGSFGHLGLSSAQNLYLRATPSRSVAGILQVIEGPEERGFFFHRSANTNAPSVVLHSSSEQRRIQNCYRGL